MQIKNPFHSGELLVQELARERSIAERSGSVIANTITPSALPFLSQEQLFVVGSSSPQGEMWSSILFGPKGFLESGDGKTLRIHLKPEFVDSSDPFWKNNSSDSRMGGLAIELATRRRLRINGHVIGRQPDLLTVAVDEAYPNCPKYIQRRFLKPTPATYSEESRSESGSALTGVARKIVEAADTMFVASSNPTGGIDVSHRGGHSGFVTVVDERSVSVPDYQGNSMFNTLGNFSLNSAAGILIVDFASHRTLQLTGNAQVHWDQAKGDHAGGNTGRSWTLSVEHWLLRQLPLAYEWEFLDYSPFNPA